MPNMYCVGPDTKVWQITLKEQKLKKWKKRRYNKYIPSNSDVDKYITLQKEKGKTEVFVKKLFLIQYPNESFYWHCI